MGFKEIYLLGFDLDQIYQMYSRDSSVNVRFYGSSPIIDNDAEKNSEKLLASTGMDWITFWIIWDQCALLKAAALEKNIKIINATQGGILNIFDRAFFEDVI